MSSLMPSFIYPPVYTTGQTYTYNYKDLVNVSWSWDAPPGASVFLILWISSSGSDVPWSKENNTVATSGSYLSQINFTDIAYPGSGHFNLWARFENNTVVTGQNGADIAVIKNDTTAFQCHNCTTEASSSIAPTSPTGTTTAVTNPVQPISPDGGGLSGGPIAGIVVGVIFAVAMAAVLGVLYQRSRTKGRTSHQITRTERPQESKEGVNRPNQKTELGGTELYEIHDSARPAEKDSTNQPLMSLAEVGTYP